MKSLVRQKMFAMIGVGLLLIAISADQASGYSASLSYYEGFDLENGTVETDPTVLMIVVGVLENIKQFLGMTDIQLDFSLEVDIHVESGTLISEDTVKIAFLKNTAYESVTADVMPTLEFEEGIASEIMLTDTDTAVLMTADGGIFKIGNMRNNANWTMAFDYEKLGQTVPTPEPSTMALLAGGLIGLIGMMRRKKMKGNTGALVLTLYLSILILMTLPMSVFAQTVTWQAEYFDSSGTRTAVQAEAEIDYDWGKGYPGNTCQNCYQKCDQANLIFQFNWNCREQCDPYSCLKMPVDNFTVRWTTIVNFDAGNYTFFAKADENRIHVWLDDKEIFDDFPTAPVRTLWNTISQVSGGVHKLRVEYHHNTGAAQVLFKWRKREDLALLTVQNISNFGNGTITGENIACNASQNSCYAIYEKDEKITLKASADTVSVFGGWSGACNGTGDCIITMDTDKTVGARFDTPWKAEYFNGSDISIAPQKVQTEPTIDANWGTEPPGGSTCHQVCVDLGPLKLNCHDECSNNWAMWSACHQECTELLFVKLNCHDVCSSTWSGNFSVRWTKKFNFDTGAYTFVTKANDTMRVYVDNNELLNSGEGSHPVQKFSKTVVLNNGAHDLRVEYHHLTGAAQAAFQFGKDSDFSLLTVVKPSSLGAGKVTDNTQGIDCGTDCTELYEKNAQVQLTAAPEPGSTFSGWEGACSGTGDCSITMDAAKTVTAKFEPFWRAGYYNGTDLSGTPVRSGNEAKIDYTFGGVFPDFFFFHTGWPGWPVTDSFSVRWTRSDQFDASPYTFVAKSDNGRVHIWFDNTEIINANSEHDGQTYWKTIDVSNGVHSLRVEYAGKSPTAMVQFRQIKGRPATLKVAECPHCVKVGQTLSAEQFKFTDGTSELVAPEIVFSPSVVPVPQEDAGAELVKDLPFSDLWGNTVKLHVGNVQVNITAAAPNNGTVTQTLWAVDESQVILQHEIKIPGADLANKASGILKTMETFAPLGGCKISTPALGDLSLKASLSPLCCQEWPKPYVGPALKLFGNGDAYLGGIECGFPIIGIPNILSVDAYLEADASLRYTIDGQTTCQDASICGMVDARLNVGGGVHAVALWGFADAHVGLEATVATQDGSLCYNTGRGLCLKVPKACATLKAVGEVKLLFGLSTTKIDSQIGKACANGFNLGNCL